MRGLADLPTLYFLIGSILGMTSNWFCEQSTEQDLALDYAFSIGLQFEHHMAEGFDLRIELLWLPIGLHILAAGRVAEILLVLPTDCHPIDLEITFPRAGKDDVVAIWRKRRFFIAVCIGQSRVFPTTLIERNDCDLVAVSLVIPSEHN